MTRLKYFTGQVHNRLTVINYSHSDRYGKAHWNCLCRCGNKITADGYRITSGHTKSCGCLNKEKIKKKGRGLGCFKDNINALKNAINYLEVIHD